MRSLLFLISAIFSFIFYNFYLLSNSKNLLGENIPKVGDITSLSQNLLIETSIFLVIGIIFLFLFSSLEKDGKFIKKESFYSICFYLALLIPFFLSLFGVNKIITILIIIFIFGDFSFRVLSNIPAFSKQKINIRYFGLALNYLSVLSSIFYILLMKNFYYPLLICLFGIVFNYKVHKKYGNYVSLFVSIMTIGILLFYLLKFAWEFFGEVSF